MKQCDFVKSSSYTEVKALNSGCIGIVEFVPYSEEKTYNDTETGDWKRVLPYKGVPYIGLSVIGVLYCKIKLKKNSIKKIKIKFTPIVFNTIKQCAAANVQKTIVILWLIL